MVQISPNIVADALLGSLSRRVAPERWDRIVIEPEQNLLELVDSFGFAELILELEAELDVELPLTEVDLGSIVHVNKLISFVCNNNQ